MKVRTIFRVLALALPVGLPAMAQMGDGIQDVAMGGGRMVRGTVTVAAANHLSVKTETGDIYEVLITPNTQVRKGRDLMKATDIRAGDGIGAMGEMDAPKKTVHALIVMVVDAEQLKKAREAMGKTLISGTVTAIDELKITVKRTDDVMQTIQVDEDTSFRKGGRGMGAAFAADGLGGGMGGGRGPRPGGAAGAPPAASLAESLTLADVKVGSVIAGQGAIKNGFFVPTQLAISDPAAAGAGQQQRRRRPDGAAPAAPGMAAPGAGTPATVPPTTGTEPK